MKGLKKYISYANRILKRRLTGKNIPILVTLCVTNRCNLRCIYCYEEYYDRNYREFTTDEILALIDELHSMGTKYISINGGEALLRKDIDQIIDKINEKNILCHLSTNGILVKYHIPALKKVDSIAISIDGNRECNDLNRGKGTYDKIIEALNVLRDNNIKYHIHTVLTRNNKDAPAEILQLAIKYDIKAQFSILRMEDSPDKSITLSDEEIQTTLKKLISYKKEGYPVFFSAEAYESALNWPFSYDRQFVFGDEKGALLNQDCHLKRASCHIEANGMVYPCVVLVNKFKALNFLETGFKKAWENIADCDCRACYNICLNDLNRIFKMDPSAMLNAFGIASKRLVHR